MLCIPFPGHNGEPAGVGGNGPADPLDAIATPAALERDQPLFREGETADNVFEVTSGTIRVFKLLPDGRRQIIGFLEAGDFSASLSTKTVSTVPKP